MGSNLIDGIFLINDEETKILSIQEESDNVEGKLFSHIILIHHKSTKFKSLIKAFSAFEEASKEVFPVEWCKGRI